ncbi:hypothetical protein DAY19_04765 [Halobacteriovorax vibrionivorans]|uniref:Uncharacterized protein n=1 Tax=Halobacteriovorax vibrionivorans TaxID=2152716 RepID=A0ABY0IMH6_9BACT|nr:MULTISPECIES: hypothetical protein [Halobacteriovorax]RZF23086.1 hypothetical protein DAY19_04765 [Halobacteriovorax vibrionivorans]TGD49282.1 hypothetical protein EP118_00315 [Halobacteriovorax sp. Y22]
MTLSIYASGGVVGDVDTLRMSNRSGVIGDVDTLRELPSVVDLANLSELMGTSHENVSISRRLLSSGDYDFNSSQNRWVLKTKSRVVSVASIDLIDEYEEKQVEVSNFSSNIRSKIRNLGSRILERRIKRGVRFKNYKIDDFDF